MLDNYKIITISHKDLVTEDLANFICKHDTSTQLVDRLKEQCRLFNQDEILYLSTCNRVMYLLYGQGSLRGRTAVEFIAHINPDLQNDSHTRLDKFIQYYEGTDAVRHLFEVCSSIDSLVVGEREIFRQFREAYQFSRTAGLSGDAIRILEKATVRTAKDVYTNTHIGAKPVSIVSLAIQEFLKRKVSKTGNILLIGSGETNSTVGRFLKKNGYHNIVIFNRSLNNALELSQDLKAKAYHLKELANYREGFDAIFACTAAQEAILTENIFDTITTNDQRKVLVDLSIPRNICQNVANYKQVEYISIDSLRSLAEENLRARSGNIAAARIILNSYISDFELLYRVRNIERSFSALPQEIDKIRDRALEKIYKSKLERLQPEAIELIEEITAYMAKKCIAAPIKLAKKTVAS